MPAVIRTRALIYLLKSKICYITKSINRECGHRMLPCVCTTYELVNLLGIDKSAYLRINFWRILIFLLHERVIKHLEAEGHRYCILLKELRTIKCVPNILNRWEIIATQISQFVADIAALGRFCLVEESFNPGIQCIWRRNACKNIFNISLSIQNFHDNDIIGLWLMRSKFEQKPLTLSSIETIMFEHTIGMELYWRQNKKIKCYDSFNLDVISYIMYVFFRYRLINNRMP